jgi:tyrosyl-tRNA synthetase
MDFISELKWRGMIHDMMPGTEEQLKKESTSAYVGFDPSSDSLHIGNLVSIMMLKHFQRAGHKPIALVGGATGMIGDPSGKKEERKLLDEDILRHNEASIKKQLEKFLDFGSAKNKAEMVNNYDWMKKFSFLDFIREIGKHISVSYMLAKDSVKTRLESGISFTEFSYQLVQAYDFLWLFLNKSCKLQMGGSDQWGNITTGSELIRRITGSEAYALTSPLITKADGSKFGKSEGENIWLDPKKTSPYRFYQFWINTSDEDASTFIKIFSMMDEKNISEIVAEHQKEPHKRLIQKELSTEISSMVHSKIELDKSIQASEILFGQAPAEAISEIDKNTLMSVMQGVPQFHLDKALLDTEISMLDLLSLKSKVFNSKGEARRMIADGALSINKKKATDPNMIIGSADLLLNEYLLVQKGKKNFNILIFN